MWQVRPIDCLFLFKVFSFVFLYLDPSIVEGNQSVLTSQKKKIFIYSNASSVPIKQKYIHKAIFEAIWESASLMRKIYLSETSKKNKTISVSKEVHDLKIIRISSSKEKTISELDSNSFHLQIHSLPDTKSSIFVWVTFIYKKNILHKKKYLVKETDVHKKAARIALNVRKNMCGDECASLRIDTFPKEASIYLEGMYIGKSPLNIPYLMPFEYHVEILKEGHETHSQKISTIAQKSVKHKIYLKKRHKLKNYIYIESEPKEANVYLNIEYKGKTPLKIYSLDIGTHQIKIVKENYHSLVKKIRMTSEKKELKLNFILTKAEESLVRKNQFIGPITYQHMYTGLFITSLAFWGTGIYYSIAANRTSQRLSQSLSTTNTSLYTDMDRKLIQESNEQKIRQTNFSILFYVLGGIFSSLSLYFFLEDVYFLEDSSENYVSSFFISFYPEINPYKKKSLAYEFSFRGRF